MRKECNYVLATSAEVDFKKNDNVDDYNILMAEYAITSEDGYNILKYIVTEIMLNENQYIRGTENIKMVVSDAIKEAIDERDSDFEDVSLDCIDLEKL